MIYSYTCNYRDLFQKPPCSGDCLSCINRNYIGQTVRVQCTIPTQIDIDIALDIVVLNKISSTELEAKYDESVKPDQMITRPLLNKWWRYCIHGSVLIHLSITNFKVLLIKT